MVLSESEVTIKVLAFTDFAYSFVLMLSVINHPNGLLKIGMIALYKSNISR